MSTVYSSWGFTENPFSQKPLPPNDEGASLLVGREAEVDLLKIRLGSPPKLVTVEGRNGIGKTSVINVAAYKSWRDHVEKPSLPPLIPCDSTFQLSPDSDADSFTVDVLRRAILTVHKYADELEKSGRKSSGLPSLVKWISDPSISGSGFGMTVAGYGATINKAKGVNTGDGFKSSGFEIKAREVLSEVFSEGAGGSVVCVVDNLELMKTSKDARDLVEALRDRAFSIPGIRWVLSGASGIVRGIGSTPRMSGYLHDPIDVGDIKVTLAEQILERRINAYRINEYAALPIGASDFSRLFQILNANIRDTLSEADHFCTAMYEQRKWSPETTGQTDLFQKWMAAHCTKRLHDAERTVTNRPWQLFDQIVKGGGQCAPGDYEQFDFDTPQAMRSNVLKLEEANLIQSLRDEDDNRRKTILVTSNGWMVHCAKVDGLTTLFGESRQ